MKKSAFTLIEMLGVLFITVIIMSLTLPAIRGLMGGQRIDQAQWQVRTALAQAKTMSIRHKCHTAVIFPTGKSEVDTFDDHGSDSFQIVELERIDDDKVSFQMKENSDYTYPLTKLPKHIVISYIGLSKKPGSKTTRYQSVLDADGNKIRAIIFKRNGILVGLQQFIHLAQVYEDEIRLDYDMRMLKIDQYTGHITIIDPEEIDYVR